MRRARCRSPRRSEVQQCRRSASDEPRRREASMEGRRRSSVTADSIRALRELAGLLVECKREAVFLGTASAMIVLGIGRPLSSYPLNSLVHYGAIPLAVALAF